MSTEQNQLLEAETEQAYEKPAFERHRLDVVTLGGTPGAGDSGATGSEETGDVFGRAKEHEDEGFGDEDDGSGDF